MEQTLTQLQKSNRLLIDQLNTMTDLYNSAKNAALNFREDSIEYKGLWHKAEEGRVDWRRAAKIMVGGYVFLMVSIILIAIYWHK